jgi:citrate synthase
MATTTTPAAPPAYSPGLEGVIAGETKVCLLDPDHGLFYRGYNVYDLATKSTYEEVAYLLLHGELPKRAELDAFKKSLTESRALPPQVVEILRQLPKSAHPMDVLRTGVSALGTFDPELTDMSFEAKIRKATRLIAKMSTIVTTAHRLSQGKEPVAPNPKLPHAANFLYCLSGKEPDEVAAKAMDCSFIIYAEHDFNASTFAARVTCSTLSDIYSAITSAIGTLKGPLHGGANEEAMKMLLEIGDVAKTEDWVRGKLARHEKIMGFGHRVYKHGDLRVPLTRQLAQKMSEKTGEMKWFEMSKIIETIVEKEKGLCANVDFYSASVYYLMGIPAPLYTPIFALARVAGWSSHVIEHQMANKLIRPRSIYTGARDLKYVPIDERG